VLTVLISNSHVWRAQFSDSDYQYLFFLRPELDRHQDLYQDFTKPNPKIMTNTIMETFVGSKASSTTTEHHDYDPDMSTDTSVEKPTLELRHDDLCNNPTEVKRDFHGLPLVPQPSRFKDDPLVSKCF
jgi:hypothetical protein